MLKVICPVCRGQVDGKQDGKIIVVQPHDIIVNGTHEEECAGSDNSVGEESLVKDEAA
jgi:hypothetical protein